MRGSRWHLRLSSSKSSFCDNSDSSGTLLLSLGTHKRRKVVASLSLFEPKIVVQYSEQLDLRLGDLEDAKVTSVFRPVNVLRARVVKVLGGNDQCRQEDPMARSLGICVG